MSRIVRNTSAVAAAFFSNTVLSFLQVKLLTRYLAQAELGEYSATFAIGAILSILAQLGLPTVVLRFTAKYDALGMPARIRKLVGFAWGIVASLAVVILIATSRLGPDLLPRLYEVPPLPRNVLLATAVFVATALRQVTYAGFDGLRRMSYPAVLENLNVGMITLAIAITGDRLTVPLLLTISLVSGTAVFLVAAFLLLARLGELRPQSPAPAGTQAVRPLLPDITPFWWGAALNGIVGIGFGHADKLLVSLFLSFEMVSIFFVAERVVFLVKRFLAVPLQVASPEITRRWELGRRDELRHDVGLLLKIQFALGVLVASLLFVAAEAAVLVVSNASFLEASGLLRVLTFSVVLMAFYAPITTLLRAIERIGLALVSDVLWLSLYVGLGVVFMPRLGLVGIVLAQVAASAVTTLWNLAAGHRVARIIWDVPGLVRILVSGAVLVLPGYGAVRLLAHPLAGVAVAVAIIPLFNLLLVASGALTADDRRRLRELLGSGRPARFLDAALFWPTRIRRGRDRP